MQSAATSTDFYPTPPLVTRALVDFWEGRYPLPLSVFDPCAGVGCLLAAWANRPYGSETIDLSGVEMRSDLVRHSGKVWRTFEQPSPIFHGDGLKCLENGRRSEDDANGPRRWPNAYKEERRELIVINPPFKRADDWVNAGADAALAFGSSVAILLRSQWIDDGNTKGRHSWRAIAPHPYQTYHQRSCDSILRIPWRVSFDGKRANSCTYAWHVWTPYKRKISGVETYWSRQRAYYERDPKCDRVWKRAAKLSSLEHG